MEKSCALARSRKNQANSLVLDGFFSRTSAHTHFWRLAIERQLAGYVVIPRRLATSSSTCSGQVRARLDAGLTVE